MNFTHFIRTLGLARRNFIANGKRNVFSVLTVILGSMAIGAVFTVNANVDAYIDELIARSGGPNLSLHLRSQQLSFSEADMNALKAISSVRYLVPDAMSPTNFLVNGSSIEITAIQTSESYTLARPIELVDGQFLSAWDQTQPSKNIVLSPVAVDKLKLEHPIGMTLTINFEGHSFPAQVIGVAKPLYDTNERGLAWLPGNFFQSLTGFRGNAGMILGFSSYENLDFFEQRTQEVLNARYENLYEIYNPRQMFEATRNDYRIFIQAGAIIGVLALMAGSVGVMNMMLVGIQVRTREIGLYRALGFPTGVVLLAFLSEALMILLTGGLFGAILGCAFGIGIAARIVTTQPFFSQSAFLMALASSFVVGFVFAYIPARRAAAMDTVEALRS